MQGFNSVVIAGHAVADPVLERDDEGTATCTFRLRVSRRFKDAGGAMREEVCEIGVEVRGRTAETVAAHLRKGGAVLIHGRLVEERTPTGSTCLVQADAVKFLSATTTAAAGQAK